MRTFSSLLLASVLALTSCSESPEPGGESDSHGSSGSAPAETETTKPAEESPKEAADGSAEAEGGGEASSASGATKVVISTTKGDITLELNAEKAPQTVANFLSYTRDGFFTGTVFHRVIPDFMIQGGGFEVQGNNLVKKPTKPPVQNEAKNGLKNMRGTVAMARTPNPHSATAQFFINHTDNENLDYPSFDGWGYAVFGKVVEGMDVVDAIAEVETTSLAPGQRGHPGPRPMENVPVEDVFITGVKVVE